MLKQKTIFERVGDMHQRAGFSHVSDGPAQLLSFEEYDFRVKFILEEWQEFIDAHEDHASIVGCADALADIIVVVMGAAHYMRIPMDQILHAVMDANDQKKVGAGKRGHKNDLIKPPGWKPPEEEIKRLIFNHDKQMELPLEDS